MSNIPSDFSTTTSNTCSLENPTSQPQKRTGGDTWRIAEELALIEAYSTKVHFHITVPALSEDEKMENWYTEFRARSAALDSTPRDDAAIELRWKRLGQEYKQKHTSRQAADGVTPARGEIYDKMDGLFGTLPPFSPPCVYCSVRSIIDNCHAPSFSHTSHASRQDSE